MASTTAVQVVLGLITRLPALRFKAKRDLKDVPERYHTVPNAEAR